MPSKQQSLLWQLMYNDFGLCCLSQSRTVIAQRTSKLQCSD